MSKKTRVPGFDKPLDLDYTLSQDENKSKRFAFYTGTINPDAADPNFTFNVISANSRQRFTALLFEASIYCENAANQFVSIDNAAMSVFNYSGANFPADLKGNNPPTSFHVSGNPQSQLLRVECGESFLYQPGDLFTIQMKVVKSVNFALTDVLYYSVKMTWK